MKTRVIGCPKTIDGDLKCKEVPTSFGFDTACKVINVFTLISTSLPFCLF
jgi:6-phosphofructokinase